MYNLKGTKRDQMWAKVKSLQDDIQKLETIQDLIDGGFNDDNLNDNSERIALKFLEPRKSYLEKEVVKLYKRLKLIK